jgi:hypothetical protein
MRLLSNSLAEFDALLKSNLDVKVADNYFDLMPGEAVEITATSSVEFFD